MKTNTRQRIFEYIEDNNPISIKDIVKFFGISKEMIHRHLKKLIKEERIYKVWVPPKVYYFINKKLNTLSTLKFKSNKKRKLEKSNFFIDKTNIVQDIESSFVFFWADGVLRYWIEWFELWCKKRNLDTIKEASFYIKTIEKYSWYKNKNWFIDWKEKMKNTFDKVFLDEIYYLDFYSIEKYWKTMLWNLMYYWKQTWKKELAKKIVEIIKSPIKDLIKIKKIDSFAFIPPSIDRKVQLMDLLRDWLNLDMKELKPIKIFKDTPVPQKSLNKKEDRIINARDTIYVTQRDFRSETILLIDDAVWSWATLNETAKKIKDLWLAKKVIWLAIVWSYKWFEIINEV